MNELWNRLQRWLENNAPTILGSFNPPAPREEIDRLKAATDERLPDLYALLELRNGQDERPLFDDWSMLSAAAILREISVMRDQVVPSWQANGINLEEAEVIGPIRLTLWHEQWIPVFSDGTNLLCLDLMPASGGVEGQLIKWSRDLAPTEWLEAGFRAWLTAFVEALERGEYSVEDEYTLRRQG
jgi:cell wall assembly regulator SMI1